LAEAKKRENRKNLRGAILIFCAIVLPICLNPLNHICFRLLYMLSC
jgi:hypothetical protein